MCGNYGFKEDWTIIYGLWLNAWLEADMTKCEAQQQSCGDQDEFILNQSYLKTCVTLWEKTKPRGETGSCKEQNHAKYKYKKYHQQS